MEAERRLRQEIVEAGKRLYEKGLVVSNDGNISAKLTEDVFLITPTGVCKGDMTADQILKIDGDGNLLEGYMKITSEVKMHLEAYRKRKEIRSVVHAHPRNATAFAVAHQVFEKVTLPEVIFSIGKIALVEYATPSTAELPAALAKHIGNADACLLSNHGALTIGEGPMEAYFKMETLEHFAAITLLARQIGGERELSEEQIKALFGVRKNVFGKH